MNKDLRDTERASDAVIVQERMRYWGKFSFRIRTAVILTFFILFTALAVGYSFRTVAALLLDKQMDLELREESQDFVEQLESLAGPIDSERAQTWNRHAATHELHHWFIRVFDDNKRLLWESISVPESMPDATVDQWDLSEWDEYRFINRTFQVPAVAETAYRAGIVQVGCSTHLVGDSLAQLDRLLLWIFLIVVILGPIISLMLSGQLLNPLTELTKQAEQLSLGDKIQMLGLRGSGDELDSFAGTVNSLLKRARSQLRANEDWIANSAHQLRSPLAAITSNVEVVLGRLPEGKSADMLSSVLHECEFLNKLVQQLLLLSEANAGGHHSKLEVIPWDEMVKQSSDFFEALANTKDISIHYEKLQTVFVQAQSEHLRIVLHNVIDNAIKYTQPGGRVDIKLTQNSDQTCTLTVSDTGIGISQCDLGKVAGRFFRSNSGRDEAVTPRGTGLGLSIVKTIVEGLGGKLEIASEIGRGTTVCISLPTKK
jgi:signal transduction histidine kinase